MMVQIHATLKHLKTGFTSRDKKKRKKSLSICEHFRSNIYDDFGTF